MSQTSSGVLLGYLFCTMQERECLICSHVTLGAMVLGAGGWNQVEDFDREDSRMDRA